MALRPREAALLKEAVASLATLDLAGLRLQWRNVFGGSASNRPEPGRDFTGGEFVLTEQRPADAKPGRSRSLKAGRRRGLCRSQSADPGITRPL
jgi:hypothetical protein